MKVVVLNEKFREVLGVFKKVLKNKNKWGGVQNITLLIQKGLDGGFYLAFRTWDWENWFEGKIECFIKFDDGEAVDESCKDWRVTVNYFELVGALKQFSKKQTVILEKQGGRLVLLSENVKLFLDLREEMTVEPNFSLKENVVSEFRLVFDSEDLSDAIKCVDFARDEKGNFEFTKGYYLDLIEIKDDKVYLVATNSHRLSWYRLTPKVKSGNISIPGLCLSSEQSLILKTICEFSQNVVDIQINELNDKEKVIITFQAFPFVYKGIRQVYGFPDWLGLTPKEFLGSMVVTADIAKEIVEFVRSGRDLTKTLAKERGVRGDFLGRVQLEFKGGENRVKMEIWDGDLPSKKVMEREFLCEWSGGDFLVAFDIIYFSDIVSVLQDGFRIKFTHPAGITQFEDLKKDCWVHWLMPVDLSKLS